MPIQNTKSSVATAAFGPMIVMFDAICCIPKTKSPPIKRKECNDVSVYTSISRFVSMACTNSDPDPSLILPAVVAELIVQFITDSWLDHRIINGSWTVVPYVLVPKQSTCLSMSLTRTCLATVGVFVAPDIVPISTALVDRPVVLSQRYIAPSLGLINKSSPKLSCDHVRISRVVPLTAAMPQPVKSSADDALPTASLTIVLSA